MIKRLGVITLFICLAITRGNAQNTTQIAINPEFKGANTTETDKASLAAPDDYERRRILFFGTISKFDNNIVEILQGNLKLTVSAKVLKEVGSASRIKYKITQLVPGMIIGGIAQQFAEGQPLEVISLHLSDYKYGRLHGKIQSVDLANNTIHILNQEVLVDTQTSLWKGSQKIPLNKVEVGSSAFVNVKLKDDQLIADSISTDVGPIASAVQGDVIEVHGNMATVLTPNIQVELSNAQIRAIRSCPVLFAPMLVPGTNLRADGTFAAGNGTLLLAETALAELPDEGYLEGVLTAINQDTGTITVLDQQIKIVPDTIIQDVKDKPMLLNSLSPNSRVYINLKVVDGEIVATRLTPLRQGMGANLFTRCQ